MKNTQNFKSHFCGYPAQLMQNLMRTIKDGLVRIICFRNPLAGDIYTWDSDVSVFDHYDACDSKDDK